MNLSPRLTFILFILAGYTSVMAQTVVTPLPQVKQPAHTSQTKYKTAAALALPFFDDFATSAILPDENRWQTSGGAYINNQYAVNPISRNVATLDGRDQNGKPYPGGSVAGPSDTLTSQPISLGNLQPTDSVYLSFYWQAGGFANAAPENSPLVYLQLEFKKADGNWVQVWRQNGTGKPTEFTQAFVALKNAAYFHDDFQFRFRNIGRRNGLADIWNVDYVLLDSNRRKNQNISRDVSIGRGVSKLLKDYTAMPLKQFRVNPQAQLTTEITTSINNQATDLPAAISWRSYIKNAEAAEADTFLRDQGLIPPLAFQHIITAVPQISGVNLSGDSVVLEHGFRLDTREQNPFERANDTTSRKTKMADYFAYDDGSAEAGFSFLSNGGVQVAQRFDLAQPDRVKAFRIYFPTLSPGIAGSALTFRVWADENGAPGRQLYQQNFQVKYTEELNQFYEVVLDKEISVSGSFYIGWSQAGTVYANLGLDLNEHTPGRLFLFNNTAGWVADKSIQGALMLRPVMTGEQGPLSSKEDAEAARFKVYPNPTSGKIFLSEPYLSLRVFDISGKEVYFQVSEGTKEPVNLTQLSPGFYTLQIKTRKSVITKKLIRN